MTAPSSPWLTRVEAAKRLRMSEKTLANYASEGKGPPFWNPNGGARGGIARYHASLCDDWVTGKEKRQGLQTVPADLPVPHISGMATSFELDCDPIWDDEGPGWDLLAERLESDTFT